MNNVRVMGIPSGDLRINHMVKNRNNEREIIYETNVMSKSLNGKENKVRVLISENSKQLPLLSSRYQKVQIVGSFHSFNKNVEDRRVSELYLKPKSIERANNVKHINTIELQGIIINEVLEKNVYSGLVIETKLKVKRVEDINIQFDYIPLVAFGDIAKDILSLKKYDKISIKGRIHSRDYFKNKEKNIKATAYEVAIYKFNKISA